jgi:hypothetical protein
MKAFHEMTRAQVTQELRALYDAQPKADWNRLAVGNVILHKFRGWRITRVPPKRGFVLAENLATGEVEKLLKSQYDSADLLVAESDDTVATLRTVHREAIEKAVAAGIRISPLVQYDYPEVFTPYPPEWDEKRREKARDAWMRINELRAFHDHIDPPGWQFGVLDHRIEQTEKDIVCQEAYRADCEAGVKITKPEAIPGIVRRVDATISELREEIVTLHHLRKHLEKTITGEAGVS